MTIICGLTGVITFYFTFFEIGLTKLTTWSRYQEDANVMLIILLIVFFFASRELFCKCDHKIELTAGEQGICIMQRQEIFIQSLNIQSI